MSSSSAESRRSFFLRSGVGGSAARRSEDSASIKSYDNRARLIPLPIINARIKLDLSDESTERSRDRSHHSDYDMNNLSQKNVDLALLLFRIWNVEVTCRAFLIVDTITSAWRIKLITIRKTRGYYEALCGNIVV